MPEIKNTFVGGKMNKDLDERLIPNGQYTNALNVEVSTAEGPGIGVVKNILGNKRLESIIPNDFTCVGSIADEKNNKLYWFITTYEKDAIIEYDVINDLVLPVVVDTNANNANAALRFGISPIITGINIIDNLLFWTDNLTDPKKINIDECKKGTPSFDEHTQLTFEQGSFEGVTIENVVMSATGVFEGVNFLEEKALGGRYFFFNAKQIGRALGYEGAPPSGNNHFVRQYRDGLFLRRVEVLLLTGLDGVDGENEYFGTFGRVAQSSPFFQHDGTSSNPSIISNSNGIGYYDTQLNPDFIVGDIIYGDGVSVDIEEKHMTVIKPKPLLAPSFKINHEKKINSTANIPNLFETKLPRFAYRYKFRDGEFSAFSPFTAVVFNPAYPKDINNSTDVNVFYNRDNSYDIKDPINKAMVNSIHSIELTDFITSQTPEDVTEVDILYKQENSNVIYSISTIKHNDSEWHLPGNTQGYDLGYNKSNRYVPDNFKANGGFTKGKFIVTTENIYAALPANQLLRPFDNVPRRALAQEVTGNRIVYGNYLQNYNLENHKTKMSVSYGDRKKNQGSFETKGLPSIKSQRNYQLGVIYCDKYGRETPVFTSNKSAIAVPWADADGLKNASRSNQLSASITADFPQWVDSIKFYVKETSNEYYNLVMDRAWVVQKTYELDNSEGHMWISFPSSDRNKISEQDYLILKKQVGAGKEQVADENKFKIIDISNEAPDAIRYELVNQGTTGTEQETIDLFADATSGERPDNADQNNLLINVGAWVSGGTFKGIPFSDGDPDIEGDSTRVKLDGFYVSWFKTDGNSITSSSKKYKVLSGKYNTNQLNIMLKLANDITPIDADIAHASGDSSLAFDSTTSMDPNIRFQIEKKEEKTGEDFSGSFFVKISKNQVTELIESGGKTSIVTNHLVSAKTPIFWWRDSIAVDAGTSGIKNEIRTNNSGHGLTNYFGLGDEANDGSGDMASDNSIHHADNNTKGFTGGPYHTTNIKLTDYAEVWEGIQVKYCFGEPRGKFFLDSMYMVAGQSEASNYAKYCCVTWSGARATSTSNNVIKGDSAWSYPPLKTWLGTYSDDNLIIDDLLANVSGQGLLSTSPAKAENEDYEDKRVDGWVGHSQHVRRRIQTATTGYPQHAGITHVNGLEGLVTSNEHHVVSGRRWFSGITSGQSEYGAGVDTKTYSSNGEEGRHFMHLSFFAPGSDLHNGDMASDGQTGSFVLFGPNSIAARLQGIWGGGHFTGENTGDVFGTGTVKHSQICLEGNYDDDGNYLDEPAGPGVGVGYDIRYKEIHERQWDPTFPLDPGNKIRDFIRNLHAGSQFKFTPNHLSDLSTTEQNKSKETVYTIKSVTTKKLYNHTSWRNTFNRWEDGEGYSAPNEDRAYWSVERAAMQWLTHIKDNGEHYYSSQFDTDAVFMREKIIDFGRSHNRRLCYIIELDKNPGADNNFNPIETGMAENGRLTADHNSNEFHNIEFLEKTKVVAGVGDLNKYPAIWETSPEKQEVDLDIYFEASSNIPVRLNEKTNEIFAPLGCLVEIINAPVSGTSRLIEWNGFEATFEPGFPLTDGVNEIDYSNASFKFIKGDGGYVTAKADTNILTGFSSDPLATRKTIVFREDIAEVMNVGLAWNNCFAFGNGLESNRIQDDFNKMFMQNGVKASITTQQTYEEERRSTGMIYSGLYNSNSGINDLNQFLMAEKITKDLNPTFGSIQKLFQRRISLVAFCEDRVVSIISNKDAIFNADGNPQLISSNNVLGDANPFEGNFGISKNPESFASESYRAYFTDKNRGAVLRLSKDGLTPISSAGMHDWFRDNLTKYDALIGSFDSYKEDYNITLSDSFGENLLFNSYVDFGVDQGTVSGGFVNNIENPSIFDGDNMTYPYESADMLTSPNFLWGSENDFLETTCRVTNHPEIIPGDIYEGQEFAPSTYETSVYQNNNYETIVDETQPGIYDVVEYNYDDDLLIENGGTLDATDDIYLASYGITFTQSQYQTAYTNVNQTEYPSYTTSPADNGNLFTAVFDDPTSGNLTLFESFNNTELLFGNRFCRPTRRFRGTDPTVHGSYSSSSAISNYNVQASSSYHTDGLFSNEANYTSSTTNFDSATTYLRGCIHKEAGGLIRFNRLWNDQQDWDDWVEFRDLGLSLDNWNGTYTQTGAIQTTPLMNQEYDTAVGDSTLPGLLASINNSLITSGYYDFGGVPNSIYNGEEIEVKLTVRILPSENPQVATSFNNSNPPPAYFHHIIPRIELRDGEGNGAGSVIAPGIIRGVASFDTNEVGFKPFGTAGAIPTYDNANFEIKTDVSVTNLSTNPSGWELFSGTNGYIHEKDFANSSIVDFPLTHFGPTPTAINSGQFTDFDTIDQQGRLAESDTRGFYTCVARFKFTDPSQNLLLPANQNIALPVGEIADVQTRIVVENLVVRIGQVNPDVYTSYWPPAGFYDGYSSNSAGSYPNTNGPNMYAIKPVWDVVSIEVKKLVNVTAPQSYELSDLATTLINTPSTTAGLIDSEGSVFIDKIPTDTEGTIPAWTEVQNSGINGWDLNTRVGINNSYSQQVDEIGSSYPAEQKTRVADGVTYNWLQPDPAYSALASNHGTGGYTGFNIPAAVDGNFHEFPEAGNLITEFPNEYYRVQTTGADAMFDLTYVLTPANQWEDDKWYLIDVEFEGDNVPLGDSLTGTGNGHGELVIVGVTNFPSNGVHGDIVDSRGVGTHSNTTIAPNSNPHANIELVPTLRTEYGLEYNGRIVLRAIFKVHPNSWVASSSLRRKKFILRFARFTDGTKITKIISRKLSTLPNGGEAESWIHSSDNPVHSLQKRRMYFDNLTVGIGSALMWENSKTTGSSGTGSWDQTFETGNTPQTSARNWRLRFKVSNNPNTQSMNGVLNGVLQNDFGDFAPGECNGMIFNGIDAPGTYEFTFNMDGNPAATDSDGNPIWTASKINDASWTPTIFNATGVHDPNLKTNSTLKNKIRFFGGTGSANPLTCAISEILLTDETEVLTGGTANSWSWNGFDDALESYIFWNQELGRIEYTDCPITDPLYNAGNAEEQISVSQFIELPIKKGERYKVSVEHAISEGRLSAYYFNSKGFGFRLFDIGPGVGTRTSTFVVGEYQWNSLNPSNNAYLPELKSTFVIRQHDDSPIVNGWIDNITMMRQYDLSQQQPITVSFNERINGWTSFKSFVPENGLSLSKKYFTFLNGGLWQHYMPMQYNVDLGKWDTSSIENATNYNRFYNGSYDHNDPASVTAVLNNEPSIVKVFNTLNYEGSQSLVKVPQTVGLITAEAQVTINNVIAWNNVDPITTTRSDVMGWSCSSIQTDLEAGSVNNFIKKEGKWFGYIKGLETDKPIDTRLFSVQGVGVASSVTPI